MVKEIEYISIDEVLSRLMRHPLMKDLDREAVVQYTSDFIGIFCLPEMLEDKEDTIEIRDHRGILPCGCFYIKQVRDHGSKVCLTHATGTFDDSNMTPSWKTQGKVLFATMKEGKVDIAYKSIPVDQHGFPLIMDNSAYLLALENYIKKEHFKILFETGQMQVAIYDRACQEYDWRAGQLISEFSIPSVSEMESITRGWSTLICSNRSFDRAFGDISQREYRKF